LYSGVLWLGNTVIPGSPNVIIQLQEMGKRVFYVTNNSSKTRDEIVSKCSRLGYPATRVCVHLSTLVPIIKSNVNLDRVVMLFFISINFSH
jgi:ribonucleotide monophosphatase NagD (HAD superfamily)